MKKLQAWRIKKKLTMAQMGDLVGVTRQMISLIERGEAYPSRKLAKRIEAATKGAVKAADLLGV